MIRASLIDAATNKIIESFSTSFGRILGISTYQREKSLWQSLSWAAAVGEHALVSPDADGSIEICDILLVVEKSNGTVRLHFDDATNEKEVINVSLADGSATVATNLVGKVSGWRNAELRCTVTGTHDGSLLVTFVKHNKANSKTYDELAMECGW